MLKLAHPKMNCPHCQKELPENFTGDNCPACGQVVNREVAAPARRKFHALLFFAALLAASLTDKSNDGLPVAIGLFGGGAAGILCGIWLGIFLGTKPVSRFILSFVFVAVFVPVCVFLCFLGCSAGGFQLNLH